MAVFKCKMCGGNLDINESSRIAVCESCGTKQTLPRLDDERRLNLYDRANHFRRNNEFDKAMSIYETILNEDTTDAEAYWSLILCKYGIEYVEDIATHKRVITCNRTQYTSVFADEDYKAAIKNADSEARQLYIAEATEIDSIQKGILDISSKEEPFDVFICYKETDNNGRRTQDSVLAQELYFQLKNEGFKVFFSRITLEDKLGTAYEPYIFAALNSSKVMVVVTTLPEYVNAPWVRNEWGRFLAINKNDHQKVLIPAYRDMDPYDLPNEFSHLQAQDMSKLGFMQDLVRGIKKIVGNEAQKANAKENAANTATFINVAPLLKRAFLFFEDGEFDRADECLEQALNQDPENAEAYLGKLMIECGVAKKEELLQCDKTFDDSKNYQKILRYADSNLSEELKYYNKTIQERNDKIKENQLKNKIYADALEMYNAALNDMIINKVEALRSAAQSFQSLGDWSDASEKSILCIKEAERIEAEEKLAREEAERQAEHMRAERERREELFRLELNRQEEINRIKKQKRNKMLKTAAIALSALLLISIVIVLIVVFIIIPNNKYNYAVDLMDNEDYQVAMFAFLEIDNYKDSGELALECCQKIYGENAIISTKKEMPWLSISDNGSIDYIASYDVTDVVIPAVFNGKTVTSIEGRAFSNCAEMESIIIPNSVQSIGVSAFVNCTGLKNITISDSVTDIGAGAFANCTGLTEVIMPKSIKKLNGHTFKDCTGLVSITIPNSVTSIGTQAFSGCTGLTDITIPNSVTSIGTQAFSGCTGLTDITVPNSVTSIGIQVFSGCTGLTDITIPNSVTSIGAFAFNSCTELKTIIIPQSVNTMGREVFLECANLTVYVEAASKPDKWRNNWNASCPVVWNYKGE